MAFDEELAGRVRKFLEQEQGVVEKKMFGGLSFLLQNKMCCGVLKDDLVVRLDPRKQKQALAAAHVRPMDFTGRPLSGFVFVSLEGVRQDRALARWVRIGVDCVKAMQAGRKTKKA